MFLNEENVIIPSYTQNECKQILKLTTELGFSFSQLIENAGRSVAELAMKMLVEASRTNSLGECKVVVLVGPGGNGATGICAARHLANKRGINVQICKSRGYYLSDAFQEQEKLYKQIKGKEAHVGSLPVEPVDLIIDAMIGCGLRLEPFDEATLTLIKWTNSNGGLILSVDVPTGVDCSTSLSIEEHIHPTATVALGFLKSGLIQEKSGDIYLTDVGIPFLVFSQLLNSSLPQTVNPFKDSYTIKINQRKTRH